MKLMQSQLDSLASAVSEAGRVTGGDPGLQEHVPRVRATMVVHTAPQTVPTSDPALQPALKVQEPGGSKGGSQAAGPPERKQPNCEPTLSDDTGGTATAGNVPPASPKLSRAERIKMLEQELAGE